MTEHTENDLYSLKNQASLYDNPDLNAGKHEMAGETTAINPVVEKSSKLDALPILTPSQIEEPALLIDNRMRVTWQNKAAAKQIWHGPGTGSNDNSIPDIFDLLFDPLFKRKVENWRKWVLFFIQQMYHMLSEEQLLQKIQVRDEDQKEILKEMIRQMPSDEDRSVFSGRMRQLLNDGKITTFWVVAIQFEQGRYLVFKSSISRDTIPAYGCATIEQRFERVYSMGNPSSMPVFLLAARLSKAQALRTEMLADEYSQLLTRLYRQSIKTIEKYGGMFHKLTGSAFLVFFLPDPQHDNPPQQIVDCALELKAQMDDLAREWKIRKGWLHDLSFDMGLHWAEEHIGVVTSTIGEFLTAFGDAQHVATALSRLASGGQIWATKALINQIPPLEQKRLRFGIFRTGHPHHVLINKCFTRIGDIPSGQRDSLKMLSQGLGNIAATQIFDRQV